MHAIISCIILIYCIHKASQAMKKPKAKRIQSAEICYKQRNIDYEKSRKEAIRQAKEREKELIQAEKQRQKKEQAQAYKVFLMQQLEIINDIINEYDDELSKINKAIKHDIDGQYYDSEIRHRKQKEQIVKKIMSAESKIHILETRLAKANYIIKAG